MDDLNSQSRGQWVFVDAVNGDNQMVMRLRIDRPSDADIASYSSAVLIGWEYPQQQGTASPPADVLLRMEVYGEAVTSLCWATGCSYLMYISTGFGMRKWCYYTKDRVEFMRRFNALLVGHNRYPLIIEFCHDPEWKDWLEMRYAYERTG